MKLNSLTRKKQKNVQLEFAYQKNVNLKKKKYQLVS